MKVELLSSKLELVELQKALLAERSSFDVVIVHESEYAAFEKNRDNYKNHRWIFYGSKEFINSTFLKESFQSNLWAVVVEHDFAPKSWSVFVDKLFERNKEEHLVKRIEIKQHPPQKEQTVNELENLLKKYKLSSRVVNHMLIISDELLMNALYDAPYSEEKGYIYDQTPRNAPLNIDRPVYFELYETEGYLKVKVTDFFGSLKKPRTLYHLTRQFDKKEYEVDHSKAGAGIGLAQSFKKGASLSFICHPKEKTSVEATFKIVDSYLEHLKEHKFVVFNFAIDKEAAVKKGA